MSALPQHSLASFRRFEPDIALVLSRYPLETLINPSPFSTTTYISRFRDAVNSMELNSWTSELFTLQQCNATFKFRKSDGPFIVTHGPDRTVRIGNSKPAALTQTFQSTPSLALTSTTNLDATDEELFLAVITLKERELLDTRISFTNVSPSQLSRLEASPVIAYDEPTPGTFLLL